MPENKLFWWQTLGSFGVSVWVGLGTALQILLWLMAIDFCTGLIAAWIGKDVNSRMAKEGIARKLVQFLLVISAKLVTGTVDVPGIADNVGTAFAGFFIVAEFISIAENYVRSGGRMPAPLASALSALQAHKLPPPSITNSIKASASTSSSGEIPQAGR